MKRARRARLPGFVAVLGLLAAPAAARLSAFSPRSAAWPPAEAQRAEVRAAKATGVPPGPRAPTSLASAPAPAPGRDVDSPVAEARRLALAGRRAEAILLLDQYLQDSPGDTEARTLLGTVLSWERRYDEARRHLQQVLAERPGHGDALPALMNVELWSGHPERAEALGREAAGREAPPDFRVSLGRARALAALGRTDEARDLLRRILRADAGQDEARRLLSTLAGAGLRWQLTTTHLHDRFGDDRTSWDEVQVALERRTAAGPFVVRAARAARFGLTDTQVEIDAYPSLRAGTYAYLNAGLAPAGTLYPGYRVGLEVYRSLGRGFEASAGLRHLGFARATTIYGGTLTKYRGDWMLTGRLDVARGAGSGAASGHAMVRRFFGPTGRSHVSLRYGHGRTREDVRSVGDTLVDADTLAGEVAAQVGARLECTAAAGVSAGERRPGVRLRQYSFRVGIGWRF
jgi:YaiO family outer membrane protein